MKATKKRTDLLTLLSLKSFLLFKINGLPAFSPPSGLILALLC